MDKKPLRKMQSLLAGKVRLTREKKSLFLPGGNLSGVCEGLGKFFGVKPLYFRVGFVAAAILTNFIGIGVYGLCALFLPDQEGNSLFEELRQMRTEAPKKIYEGGKHFVLCQKCDSAVKKDAKYCHSCGNRI